MTAVVLIGASLFVGGTNRWAFQRLEHGVVLEILGCGQQLGEECRQLGRQHLEWLHLIQYSSVALSLVACGLVIWLAMEVQRRAKLLTGLSERLARGEPPDSSLLDGSDEFAAIGRSFDSAVMTIMRQHAAEREALGERINTLMSLSSAFSQGPVSRREASPEVSAPRSFASSGRFAIVPSSPSEPPRLGQVLLVDDDPEVLRGFARILGARGHAVTTASRGTEAMEKLSAGQFDVVVSDISMPNMDGIQLLREVRRRDLLIPVVLATGQPDVRTAAEAVEIGAFQYLIKPIRGDSLCQVVEQAVRMHQIARVKQEAAELFGQGAALGSDRAGLEASFERTLDGLWVAFQPIVDVNRRSVYAYESLMRSNEPALPHPGAVLDAAERLERLDALGRTIRAKAAAHAGTAPELPQLFVNLHVRDLLDPDLLDPNAALSKIANRVVLEITERSSLEDVRDARTRVAALREMGFRIAVDDMGAGYAGLSSFALLEPDVVKLDMSLIRDVHQSATKSRVVRSMTELSKGMGIEVVAEGVETADERDKLIELGCDLLQGYLFAKPGKPFPKVDWGNLSDPRVADLGSVG
ncbi:MAG TPA: EAL domain-containing protein [Polyangiaceae bacterium]|jgi:EAL domain-containing protein (putative c-di-GMP-specific phosphodiesterase class I)|nr:EAL domain-containing protein [Polyangiaceae bacterium]